MICTFCEKPKPDDGMKLCAECAKLADDVFDEMGFDPESILDKLRHPEGIERG